ncbi:putative LRR receptor-like serine/threonine-protein kinase [Forsythia ovata]|uniref:LRR receptor-like serine/threonine-protein kinase n=1 Tax=Forsythia ovata TaxID=205694 RepID=A0ABD1W7J2_9LAMI
MTHAKKIFRPGFFMSLLWLMHFNASDSAMTNETDRQDLLDIKNLITQDPFHVLNSWNDSIHFCNCQLAWNYMQQCPSKSSVLNISSLKLVGPLSPSVGNLSFIGRE